MPRSRKNKKGILEVGFFVELKNRHIIQVSLWPPNCWPGPLMCPFSPQKQREQRGRQKTGGSEGGECLGLQRPLVSEPGKHRKDR